MASQLNEPTTSNVPPVYTPEDGELSSVDYEEDEDLYDSDDYEEEEVEEEDLDDDEFDYDDID